MLPDDQFYQIFRGIHFFDGIDRLPKDILIDLESIRDWAECSGMIFDPDQILNDERIADISQLCSVDDKLLIAIALSGETDSSIYLESPYLPTPSLIHRKDEIALVFWKLTSSSVKFGFWLDGCNEEFVSESTGTRIITKFADATEKMSNTYPIKTNVDGSKEITVEGSVRAMFSRDGRSFDVELTFTDEA